MARDGAGLDHDFVVEQARGVLAERLQTTVDAAGTLLRDIADRLGVGVEELAAAIVRVRASGEPVALPRECYPSRNLWGELE